MTAIYHNGTQSQELFLHKLYNQYYYTNNQCDNSNENNTAGQAAAGLMITY